jgi:hypothetical protein
MSSEWEFVEGWKSHNGEFYGDEFDIFNQDAFFIGSTYKFCRRCGHIVTGRVTAFANYSRTVCVMTEGGCELTIKVQEVYHVYKQKEVHMKEVLNVLKIIDTAEEKVDVSKEFMEKFLPSQDPVRLTLGNGSADVIGHMSFCRMSPVRVSVEVIVSGNHAIRFEITPSDVPKVDRMNTPDPLIDVFELRRVYRHEFNTDKLKQGHLYLISSKYSKVLAHLDEVTENRIQITIIRSAANMASISEVAANLQQITAESAYDMGLSFEEVCDLDSLDGALK